MRIARPMTMNVRTGLAPASRACGWRVRQPSVASLPLPCVNDRSRGQARNAEDGHPHDARP
jgi:hypothetical protein